MKFALKTAERKDGDVQPHWKIPGLKHAKVRLPFIHYRWEFPEMIQASVVFATTLSSIPFLTNYFGVPWEIALSITALNAFLYLLHTVFGDAGTPGWITPAIPLLLVFLLDFPEGPERVQALIAVSLLVGIIFLVMGITGLGRKVVNFVPNTIKAGLLIGAAISAVLGAHGFGGGGPYATTGFHGIPWTFTAGVVTVFFVMFGRGFAQIKEGNAQNKFIGILSKAGFIPALLVGYVVGLLTGELAPPVFNLSDGLFVNPLPGLAWSIENFSIIGLGFPPASVLLQAVPMAFVAYVIAFGDIVIVKSTVDQAAEGRPDEKIEFNPGLSHIIVGVRNTIQAFIAPIPTLSGPSWVGMQIPIMERFRTSKDMHSLYGGLGTFGWWLFVAVMTVPLGALIQPALPLAMSVTLMIQAFACMYIAMPMLKTNAERGVAGFIGAVLVAAGPAIGLAAGVVVTIVVMVMGYSQKKEAALEAARADAELESLAAEVSLTELEKVGS